MPERPFWKHLKATPSRAWKKPEPLSRQGGSRSHWTSYALAIKISDEATAGLIRQRVAILLKSNPATAELPEEARKFALRGDVLIKEGSFSQALVEYRSALKFAPLNPQLHYNKALIHGQLKDYRAAIRSMNVYLQLALDAANARAAKDEIYKWEFVIEKEGKK